MQHETQFHTGPQLEVEDGESSGSVTSPQSTNNKNKKRRHRKPQPRWKVITTYVCLAALAVVLTAACQDTTLWLSANNSTAVQTDQTQQKKFDISAYSLDNVDGPQLLRLLSSFAIVLLSLALVQGSDPGYVTAENVQAAFDMVEEDEAGLLADGDNNLEEEEEEENGKNVIELAAMSSADAAFRGRGSMTTAQPATVENPTADIPQCRDSITSSRRQGGKQEKIWLFL